MRVSSLLVATAAIAAAPALSFPLPWFLGPRHIVNPHAHAHAPAIHGPPVPHLAGGSAPLPPVPTGTGAPVPTGTAAAWVYSTGTSPPSPTGTASGEHAHILTAREPNWHWPALKPRHV